MQEGDVGMAARCMGHIAHSETVSCGWNKPRPDSGARAKHKTTYVEYAAQVSLIRQQLGGGDTERGQGAGEGIVLRSKKAGRPAGRRAGTTRKK